MPQWAAPVALTSKSQVRREATQIRSHSSVQPSWNQQTRRVRLRSKRLLLVAGNWFQMVSAQERLTRTFTRSSHTYTRTERTEISKTRGGETKREVRVEESTQVGGGGSPFRDVFGDFLGRESLSSFAGITARPEGENPNSKAALEMESPVNKTRVPASCS